MRRSTSRRRPPAEPRRRPTRAAAAAAEGDDAADARALSRLRRAREAGHWDEVTRRRRARPRRATCRRSASSTSARRGRWRVLRPPARRRTPSRGSRCSLRRREALREQGRRLPVLRPAGRPGDLAARSRAGSTRRRAARGRDVVRRAHRARAARDLPPLREGRARTAAPGRRSTSRAPSSVVDARHLRGVLLAPVGVERDRLRRAGVPARLRARSAARSSAASGALGGAGGRSSVDPVRRTRRSEGLD